jgi:hypothetical protein
MIKRFSCLLVLLAGIFLSTPIAVVAKSYSFPKVDINIQLNTDRSADFIERRTFAFSGSFSQVYWEIPLSSKQVISNIGINEEGVEFTETNEELIEEVVTYLRNEGVCEASSSMFRKGIWYSTEWFVEDYGTMTEEQDSYHLYNFSEEQERTIYNELKSKRII